MVLTLFYVTHVSSVSRGIFPRLPQFSNVRKLCNYCVFLDRCKVDDTLSFHPRPDPQSQRFSLEAFQYVSQQPFVFFHCRVKICNETDPNSRCTQGCLSRKRRSLKTLPGTADDVYPLAQGPLTLSREKRDEQADEARESDQSMRVTSKYSVFCSRSVYLLEMELK